MAAKENEMRFLGIVFSAAFIFLLIGCKSQSEKTLNEFNKVNESLEKTNRIFDSSTRNLQLLGFDGKTTDSILFILNNSIAFLEKTKEQLKDDKDDQLDVAEKLLLKTPAGDTLFHFMMGVYDLAINYITDSVIKQNYLLLKETDKNKWQEKFFKMVPTIAAKTILSKFLNDCWSIKMNLYSDGRVNLKNQLSNQ